jgi:hypothetical protein
MRHHHPIEAPIDPSGSKKFNVARNKHLVRLLMIVSLISLLPGCLNQSQPAANAPIANAPTATSPTPTSSISPDSPLSSSPTIASPTSTPQTSPQAQGSPSSGVVKEIEDRLNKTVSKATGAAIQSLTCPAGTEVKVGSRFDCNAVSAGQSFAIAVEITNATGPQFQWSTKRLLVLSKLEQFIQQQIKDKNGISVTVDCGNSIRVANPGDTFECKVSDSQGQSRSAKITVKDDQGNVDVALL